MSHGKVQKNLAERVSPSLLNGQTRTIVYQDCPVAVAQAYIENRLNEEEPHYQTPAPRNRSGRLEPVIGHHMKVTSAFQTETKSAGTSPSHMRSVEIIQNGKTALSNKAEILGTKQTNRDAELEEAKSRVLQMEKTIRWWSDCTTAWRDKWNTVERDRDHLREENRNLRTRLKRLDPSLSNGQAHGEPNRHLVDSSCQASTDDSTPEPTLEFDFQSILRDLANVTIKEPLKNAGTQTDLLVSDQESRTLRKKNAELEQQLASTRIKYDELEKANQENIMQLTLVKAEYQTEVASLKLELEDDAHTRNSLELKVAELRYKVEEWQQQVSAALAQRISAETEKATHTREIRRFQTHCDLMQSQIDKLRREKRKTFPGLPESLSSRASLEIDELRKENSRLQKNLQDQMTELGHSIRRCEHYELDVWQLRSQIDLLNRELVASQNLSDDQVRLLEHHKALNQDLQEQTESLQIQLTHLQTRLKRSGGRLRSSVRRAFGEESEDDINIDI